MLSFQWGFFFSYLFIFRGETIGTTTTTSVSTPCKFCLTVCVGAGVGASSWQELRKHWPWRIHNFSSFLLGENKVEMSFGTLTFPIYQTLAPILELVLKINIDTNNNYWLWKQTGNYIIFWVIHKKNVDLPLPSVYLPSVMPKAWLSCLRIENCDLTPTHACVPISHAWWKRLSHYSLNRLILKKNC